jgi:hypothetical protein
MIRSRWFTAEGAEHAENGRGIFERVARWGAALMRNMGESETQR